MAGIKDQKIEEVEGRLDESSRRPLPPRPVKAPRSFAAMLADIKKRFPKTLARLAKS
jgi:hypothetical protein